MPPEPTAHTRLLALLGDPVAHSLSPLLHNSVVRTLGLDAVYVALRCDSASVGPLLRGIAHAGGAGNVTVPHKRAAAAALDVASDAVQRTGACNTFWLEDGRIHGDNTDVAGFAAALDAFHAARDAEYVLLLGAGGGAAAALLALLDRPARRVTLLNRTPERASALLETLGAQARVRLARDETELAGAAFDLAVNATSLGLHTGDPLPLRLDGDVRVAAAFDLVYGDGGTAWIRHARAAGVPAIDGRSMLVRQAAHAFARWWRREPPVALMEAALAAADFAMETTAPAQH